ncbi:MAG: hypothetical protein ACW964_08735 [Candidatus Hodarchaeales archaeon]|jgi:hypothetical protein
MSEEIITQMILPAIPGVGAAALSIYNFLKARRGAVLELSHIYQFGTINLHDDGKDFKLLYLTIPFENQGTSVGTVNSIKLELQWQGNKTVLYPARRVELADPEDDAVLHQEDFKTSLPILPVYVPANDGASFTFEFHDVDENPFPVDQEVSVKLSMIYDGKKKVDNEFSMKISSESWSRSESYDLAISYDFIAPPEDPDFKVTRLWGRAKDSI